MAITIKVEPQRLSQVYNEMILVLDSTNKAQDQFQFIIDINTGTSSTQLSKTSTLKISPNPDGFAVADLHKHIEQLVTFDIDHVSTETFSKIPESFRFYDVSLSESFEFNWLFSDSFDSGGSAGFTSSLIHHYNVGDVVFIDQDIPFENSTYNGVHTVTSILTTKSIETDITFGTATASAQPGTMSLSSGSPTIIADPATLATVKLGFNGVLDFIDVPNWDEDDHILITTDDKLLVSVATGSSYPVTVDDRMWYNTYNLSAVSTTSIDNLRVFTYNSSDTLIGNYNIANSYNTSADANRLLSIGVGPHNLNNTATASITTVSGVLPIINGTVSRYEVRAHNTSNGNISGDYNFNVIAPCTLYETFRLIFLDKFGSLLNINFNKVSKNTVRMSKTNYKQNHGSYNVASNTWGYNSFDRGTTNLDNEITERFKLNSDWVSEFQGDLISQMLQSPEVYHLDEAGQLIAINITTSSYEKKKTINEMIFRYTIDFETSFRNSIQRG